MFEFCWLLKTLLWSWWFGLWCLAPLSTVFCSATFNSVLIGWNFQRSLETTQPMLLIYWVNDARVNLYQIHVFGADPKSKASAMAGQHFSKGKHHHQYGRYWYINIFSQLLNWIHTTGMVCVVSSAKRVLFCLAWSGKNQTWLPWIIFRFWLAEFFRNLQHYPTWYKWCIWSPIQEILN